MISVQQAEDIILSQFQDYGEESISYDLAIGRVLAEDILADRDLPPFDRPTVDGIAINFGSYEKAYTLLELKLFSRQVKNLLLLIQKINVLK